MANNLPTRHAPNFHKASNLEMTERFLKWLVAQKYAPETQDRYYKVARKLCKYIGRKALSSVTPMDIGDFLTETLPNRWADNYIAGSLGPLRCFFDFLYLGGVVDSVAPRFLKTRTPNRPLPRAVTEAEVKKLIRAATHPRDRALIELLYATGCRIGELRVARVEEVDLKRLRLVVHGKGKERTVYFGPQAADSLKAYLKGRKTGYIFQDKMEPQKGYITYAKTAWIGNWQDYSTGKKGGVKHSKFLGIPARTSYAEAKKRFRAVLRDAKPQLVRPKRESPLHASALSFVVREVGRRAGIAKITPHVLRHTFATHLLERGANISAIQELLGHSNLSTTQIYMRVSNKAIRSAFHQFHPRG